MIRRPPRSPLFPSTPLFRSLVAAYTADRIPDYQMSALLLALEPAEQDRHERSEEHTSELQSRLHLVCRLLLEKKKNYTITESRRIATHAHMALTATIPVEDH